MTMESEGPRGPLFVLGARDPEMRRIESLLDAAHRNWLPALHRDRRVYPGNAYRAQAPQPAGAAADSTIYAVECAWPDEGPNVVHLDHHHPGDPGYGQPPQRFFQASSLGQVHAVLRRNAGAPLQRLLDLRLPQDRLVAAADHCLGAAYRGLCPGVDPQALERWCLENQARFQRRPVAEVRAELEASCRTIRALNRDGLADLRSLPAGTVPEAPHAACRIGIAVLTRVVDREGRHKIGLLGASAIQVREFLDGRMVPGLVGHYGDPARGFAGAYEPRAGVPATRDG